ncbi:hypothetical protein [Bosea sp. AK1]|uniref:hypothetical protein n=1 Tax=Bosea sp. AK1 TaxID=2587160 RepID=UPI0016395AC2|nr:hypothetical protein [Bosea sp. AK1]
MPAAAVDDAVEDIENQRRLRRDLKLTSEDIAEIDIELAIAAGLLSRPKRRAQ